MILYIHINAYHDSIFDLSYAYFYSIHVYRHSNNADLPLTSNQILLDL